MFNNLIESSSHTTELKRRGSFFLFTVATYAVLFVAAGVASIYAYDAQMGDPNTESIVMLTPVEINNLPPVQRAAAQPRGANSGGNITSREDPMASVNRPDLAPKTTSSLAIRNPPVPDHGDYVVGPNNSDPGIAGGPGTPNGGGGTSVLGAGTPIVEVGNPPTPPVRVVKPKPQMVHKRVLNSEALLLPKPPYPPLARQMRVQGTVLVQVLIDETGRVVSAKAVSGNPALVTAAQRAALEARFSPTKLNDQPVKVSGVITYNFVLQ